MLCVASIVDERIEDAGSALQSIHDTTNHGILVPLAVTAEAVQAPKTVSCAG